MKKNQLGLVAAAAAALGLGTVPALADDFDWTGADPTNPTLWDLTLGANWDNVTTATSGVVWSNNPDRSTPNNASFNLALPPASVDVEASIDVGAISFAQGDWTLGGSGVLAFGGTGTLAISNVGENTIATTIVDGSTFGAGGGVTGLSLSGGLLHLTGTNTYSGNTALIGGTLGISSLDNVGSGDIAFSGGLLGVSGTTLTSIDGRIANPTTFSGGFNIFDSNNTFTLGTALSGGGGLSKFGAGTLVVSGASTNTGATVIGGGTLRLAGGNDRLNATSNLTVGGGATLDLNGFNQTSANLAGGGVITNSSAGASVITIDSTSVSTFSGSIDDGAGQVSLVKQGPPGTSANNMLTLTGTSTYSGETRVEGGVLAVTSAAATGTGNIVLMNGDNGTGGGAAQGGGTAGAVLRVNATTTFDSSRSITLGGFAGDSGAIDNRINGSVTRFDGVISDNASGAGNLIRASTSPAQASGTIVLGGNNTYTGTTTIHGTALIGGETAATQRGGLVAAANNALGTADGGTTIMGQGWLGFTDGVQYTTPEPVTLSSTAQHITGAIRALSGDNLFAGPITLSTGSDQIGADAGSSLTLTGELTGGGGISKTGGGTVIFNSVQNYTGNTLVRLQGASTAVAVPGGTLKLEGDGALSASRVDVGTTGQLWVDSSTSGPAATARTPSLRLGQSAILRVDGNDANHTTDSFGNLNLGPTFGPGESFIIINPGAGQTSTVAFGTIERQTAPQGQGHGVTANLRGPNFGQPAGADVAQVTFSGFTGNSLVGGSATVTGYLPWMTITDTVSGLTSFATGVGGDPNGLRPLSTSVAEDYNVAVGSTMPTSGNALLNTPGSTVSLDPGASVTLNSLSLQGNNITLDGGAGSSLRVTPNVGGSLSTGTGNVISVPSLAFGSSGTPEHMVYVEGDLTIESDIGHGGSAAALVLVKTGPGELVLAGNNTFSHPTSNPQLNTNRIHNGTLSFSSSANLGDPNNVFSIFTNGELRLPGGLGLVSIPQVIRSGQAAGVTVDGANTFIRVDAGSALETANVVTSQATNNAIGFNKIGAGELRLTARSLSAHPVLGNIDFAANNLTGTSFLAEGSLTLANDAALQLPGRFIASPGTVINYDASENGTATTSRQGRVILAGTTLNVIGNDENDTTDTFANLTLDPGATAITVTPGAGQMSTLRTTSGSPTRNEGATVVFSGTNIGSAAGPDVAHIRFSSGPSMTGGILPYALADATAGGPGTHFARNSGDGETGIIANDFNVQSAIADGGNVVLTTSDASSGSVNSLHLQGSGISAGSGTLTVTSGGVLSTGGANSIDADTLSFGGAEGIVHAVSDLTVSGQITTGAAGLTKAGPGILDIRAISTSRLGVNQGTVKVLAGTGASTVGELALATGATLDLTNNSITVQGGDLDSLNARVVEGRAGGSWTGTGITSSAAAAEPGRALGIRPDGDDVVVKFTWGGDATLDGVVNISDLSILAGNWQQMDRRWHQGDFNYDGVVNISDLSILAGNWQKGAAGGTSFEEALAMFDVFNGVVVPEPGLAGLLAMGGLGMLFRRRRPVRQGQSRR